MKTVRNGPNDPRDVQTNTDTNVAVEVPRFQSASYAVVEPGPRMRADSEAVLASWESCRSPGPKNP